MIQLLVSPTANEESVNNPSVPPIQPAHDRRFHGIDRLGAAFGCASLGVVPTLRHADYIGAWLEVLREDDRAIVQAASQASKAADYLLGFQ